MSRPEPRLVETGPLPACSPPPAPPESGVRLREADAAPDGDRVYTDGGEDRVGSATSAYREERVRRWLLAPRLLRRFA
ncbi:MAG TPA: hypothetical protein VK399_01375 [Longimicrobiaceae bacterium]|nr:hypothetical protein [Longimicrobiaceae bacterium]